MMGKRKRYTAKFKARVALEALRGELTAAQLATKHGVHQTMIADPAPDVPSFISRVRSLVLNCSPSLDRSTRPLPERGGQVEPCSPGRFSSMIGGLLPIALCGRTSL